MNSHFEVQREELIQRVGAVLHTYAIHNRSGLPPFRLPHVAQRLIDGLIQHATKPTLQQSRQPVAQSDGKGWHCVHSWQSTANCSIRFLRRKCPRHNKPGW